MTSRQHTVLAVLLAIVGLYVIRLSSVEIQPWDEGLYAVRGESIVLFGDWWDQTPHALGGLYSSTPPPMTSWGVAVGTTIFGRSALGVRFFTIVCAGLALFLFYRISSRFISHQGALLGMVALGTSLHWVVYSRQAMTEVPLMMFTLLGLYAALLLGDRRSESGDRKAETGEQAFDTRHQALGTLPIALGILAIGGALMTKMTVGLLPALFFLPLLRRRGQWWKPLAIIVAGTAVAMPWYLHMFLTYGDDIWLAMSIPHLWEAVEGNAASMGPLYYVNQLVLAHPLSVVAFYFVGVAVLYRSALPEREQRGPVIALAWFVVVMLVFSLASTKNPHYVVMLLPPTILVAAYAYERLLVAAPPRMVNLGYALLASATIWVMSPSLRVALRTLTLDLYAALLLAVIVVVPVVAILLPAGASRRISALGYRTMLIIAVVAGGLQAVVTVVNGRDEEIQGGRQIAVALLEQAEYYKEFTYLYHRHNAGDAMNPQLAWYTAGWMNGWQEGYRYDPVHMPAQTYDLDAVASVATQPLPWVVYYHPGISEEVRTQVMASLAISYDVYEKLEHYTLFIKR